MEDLRPLEYQLITFSGQVFTPERDVWATSRSTCHARWETGDMIERVSPGMASIRYPARRQFSSRPLFTCGHTASLLEVRRALLWGRVAGAPVATCSFVFGSAQTAEFHR